MCEVAGAWVPAAVSATLPPGAAARPLLAWLAALRARAEEYDPLVVVEDAPRAAGPDSAFDEILSKLGTEIYHLDEFHHKLTPRQQEVSLSILNIFDECLEGIGDGLKNKCDETTEPEAQDAEVKMVTNGCDVEYSDAESTLSDVSIISCPDKELEMRETGDGDVESVFVSATVPIPAPRARLKQVSSSSSIYESMSDISMSEVVKVNRLKSESDSVSTCWSYQGNNNLPDSQKTYAVVWSHSSGFHNSDAILRSVLMQHHATISQVCFDEACDFTPTQYSVYTLAEVGDRCARAAAPVDAMSPARPSDHYEPVRAATDENIYEEIEFGCSYTDEGCSSGGSAEVECCSISAGSSYVGRDSDSPLYVNLRDHDAYAVPPDVIHWKNLLLDPYYNDDEEDEWITPEDCAVYSREQRPPLIIPRITQYRPPQQRQNNNVYFDAETRDAPAHGRQYTRLQNESPKLERSFNKADSDSPPFGRLTQRLGASTEFLYQHDHRRPKQLHLPASSSGDSLDVEVREREHGSARRRESRSMMLPQMKSPKPMPRTHLLSQPTETLSVIRQCPVKRTQFVVSGKKSKKNWNDCYMVLTNTALYFYKDQKTFSSLSRPAAELVLALRNAHVIACIQTHTRRYTRSIMLTVNYDSYLIQAETEEEAKWLLMSIQEIIYKLGPPLVEALPASGSSTDLDSLGRTPPAHRHNARNKQKAGGSSNEDLSDSTTEQSIQKSHVRSRLRKFFAKRPTMEVLIVKGIYKDEPVFGRNLEQVCPATSPRVPDFVVSCVKVIEGCEENMKTDGLYRASGNLSQVQKIRLEIDHSQNNLSVIEGCSDVHVLTGTLKLFFRELKEPLIPCSSFNRILAACSLKPREVRIKEFREIIHSLPQCNRETLKFLLEHLLRVTQYSEFNRMHTANLAIVFGPTLLWAPVDQQDRIAIDCIQQNNVVDILLNDFNHIFHDDKSKKKA